MSKLSSLLGEE